MGHIDTSMGHNGSPFCNNSETEFCIILNETEVKNMRFKKDSIDITLRIHDAATFDLINELAEAYGNRTTVLNECLTVGVPLVYERYFHRKALCASSEQTAQGSELDVVEALNTTAKQIRELRLTQDDLYVMINNLEYMLATLYNTKLSELQESPVSAEMIRQGLLSELPEELRTVKNELQHRYTAKDKQ